MQSVRVFERTLTERESAPLTFEVFEDKLVDTTSKSEWTPEGVCTYGKFRELRLQQLLTIDSMWFAWAAFYQGCQIFPPVPVQ